LSATDKIIINLNSSQKSVQGAFS